MAVVSPSAGIDDELDHAGLCVDWARARELLLEGMRLRRVSWGVLWSHVYHSPTHGLVISGYHGRGKWGHQQWVPSDDDIRATDWQAI